VLYEKDKILDFGNYANSKANGKVVHIILEPLKIVDGFFSDDKVSGMASILESDKSFTTGYYENGRLNGEALTVRSDGSAIKGIYKEGKMIEVKEISLPSGGKLNIHPKDVCTAVNFLVKEFENNFKAINSGLNVDTYDESYKVRYRDAMDSWYFFPGAGFNRILPDRQGPGDTKQNEFTCGLLVSKDFILIKKQYDNLCRQLTTCPITSLQKAKTMKLVPKLRQQKMEEDKMASLFNVPVYNGKTNTAMVRIMVEKNYEENYQLTVDIVSK
ncbi:MAG TPA: hypothetical protein VI461_07215, partial [Chitinophagaceae bacterium]|nr:hypothetical protein [Chitinophagaceae bacterium]